MHQPTQAPRENAKAIYECIPCECASEPENEVIAMKSQQRIEIAVAPSRRNKWRARQPINAHYSTILMRALTLFLPNRRTRNKVLATNAHSSSLLPLPFPTTTTTLLGKRIRFVRWLRFLRREVLPLAPPVKVNQRLHTTPFHDLAL